MEAASLRWIERTLLGICVTLGTGAMSMLCGQVRADEFQVSFAAGAQDVGGRFAGGTEMRFLATHAGRLYAGNGYWEDRPGPEGLQGAQIMVLDGPGSAWRVDDAFDERMPNGRWRDLAVGALAETSLR